MRRLAIVLTMLVAAIIPAFAQRPPDVQAFIDAILAKDINDLARHLPAQVARRIAEFSPAEQERIEHELLIFRDLEQQGGKLVPSDDPAVLISIHEKNTDDKAIDIMLDRRLSDGYESMLILKFRSKSDNSAEKESFILWLRYEEGEWRVTEIQPCSKPFLRFDEETFLKEYAESSIPGNEAAAASILRTYNTAIVTYSATYPEWKVPFNLSALGPDSNGNSSPYHAGLVAESYATPPFEISGYRFNYSSADDSAGPRYTITARPINLGRSGNRSFYTDDTAVIRSTTEDREATAADDPF